MNSFLRSCLAAIALPAAALLTAASLPAQIAPVPASATKPAGAGEVAVLLSPFEVNSTKDVGYLAQNTLSGSRMNTSLKDTPAAVSVMTPEFLADIAATTLQEALEYSLSGREDVDEGRVAGPVGDTINKLQSITFRGLPGAGRTRNYFSALTEIDTYNTERLEFSRGPNSVLFGFGSPAGTVNTSTKRATTTRSFGALSFRGGDWAERRATFDTNVAVVPRRLALRFNTLQQDRGFWREVGQDDSQRYHGAGTWEIDAKTTLRAETEYSRQRRLRTRVWLSNDVISAWLAQPAGNRTINNFANADGTARPVGSPRTDLTGLSWLLTIPSRAIVFSEAGAAYAMTSFTRSNQAFISDAANNTRNLFDFDFLHNPAMTLDSPRMATREYYRQYGATLDRRLFDDQLTVEIAFDRQTTNNSLPNWGDAPQFGIMGDSNRFMPDGTANPNAGKFYVENTLRVDVEQFKQTYYRAATAYRLDSRKRWLGAHQLSGFVERREREEQAYTAREVWVNLTNPAAPAGLLATGTIANNNNRVFRRNYFTSGQIAAMSGLAWDVDPYGPPQTYSVHMPTVADPNRVVSAETRMLPFASNRTNRFKRDSKLIATQSTFLDQCLVVTFGYRTERDRTRLSDAVSDTTTLRAPLTFGVLRPDYEPATEGITRSLGLVARAPWRSWRWLSAFYNESSSLGGSGFITGFGLGSPALLPGSSGETKDFGVKLDLLDGRIFATLTRYQTTAKNDTRNLSSVGDAFRESISAASSAGVITPADFPGLNLANGFSGDALIQANAATFDSRSEGYEAEMHFNPSRSWRFTANYAYAPTRRTNDAGNLRAVVEAIKPKLIGANGANLDVAINQVAATPGVERVSGSLFDPATPETVAESLRDAELMFLSQIGVLDGNYPLGHSLHRGNLRGNYSFTSGRLKGVDVGLGARYRSGVVAGYVINNFTVSNDWRTALLPNTGVDPHGLLRLVRSAEQVLFDLSLAYRRRLEVATRNLVWSVQLNVRDLFDRQADDKILTQIFSDGTPRQYRLTDPRQILLTTTVSF